MAFFGTFTLSSLSVNMSVAIVAMVDYEALEKNNTNITLDSNDIYNDTVTSGRCKRSYPSANKSSRTLRGSQKFLWDENMQGLVLAAFFYGHVSMQIVGAWLGRVLGRVRVWGMCIFSASICTMLLPFLARFGLPAIVATRVAIGTLTGATYPLAQALMGDWAPPAERSKLIALYFSGTPVGMFAVMPLAGALAEEFGWKYVFYVTGAGGMLWSILMLAIVYDSPASHPRISPKEKSYIQESLGHGRKSRQKQSGVPWCSILTSFRYWCIVIPLMSANFSLFVFLTMMPTYLRTMMNFDIKESGGYSSIPYLAKGIMYNVAGLSADWFIARGIKTIHVRKACSATGMFLPGVAMVALGYIECDALLIIGLLTFLVAIDTFTCPGFKTSILEIAPTLSGVTFAISNTLNCSSGFLAPQIIGLMRRANRDDPTLAWRSIFWLAAVVNFIGGIVFLLFGTSDVQEWAKTTDSRETDDKTDDGRTLIEMNDEMKQPYKTNC